MGQMTIAELEYQNKKRKTRCEMFLAKMDQLIKYRPVKATRHRHHYLIGVSMDPEYSTRTDDKNSRLLGSE